MELEPGHCPEVFPFNHKTPNIFGLFVCRVRRTCRGQVPANSPRAGASAHGTRSSPDAPGEHGAEQGDGRPWSTGVPF